LLLEPCHLFDGAAPDDPGLVPLAPRRALQRLREDELRHCVELIGELLLWTLRHVWPEAGELAIGDSAEQERVNRVHKGQLFLAKAQIASCGGGDEVDAIVRT